MPILPSHRTDSSDLYAKCLLCVLGTNIENNALQCSVVNKSFSSHLYKVLSGILVSKQRC